MTDPDPTDIIRDALTETPSLGARIRHLEQIHAATLTPGPLHLRVVYVTIPGAGNRCAYLPNELERIPEAPDA